MVGIIDKMHPYTVFLVSFFFGIFLMYYSYMYGSVWAIPTYRLYIPTMIITVSIEPKITVQLTVTVYLIIIVGTCVR